MSTATGPARTANESTTAELVAWSLTAFADQRIVLTTGFGMEGCALVDLYARCGLPLTVIYLDTGFLFEETYRLRDRLVGHYPHLRFVDRGTKLTPARQAALHGERLWERDPDLCCRLRKVDPMREALAGVDVWVTGLRRGQGPARRDLEVLEWDPRYGVTKLNPLATWSREEVWDYVRSRRVPHNPLHHRGFPSIGCTHCTRAVPGASAADYSREGRWAGLGKSECGLHLPASRPAGVAG